MDTDQTYSPAAGAGGEADDEKNTKAYSGTADVEDDYKEHNLWEARTAASLPGTPDRHRASRRQQGTWRDCASETELKIGGGRCRRRRWVREKKLDRAWQKRRSRTAFSPDFVGGRGGECVVVVRPQEGCGSMISMDMEEVRGCRDLGLEIPRDFTVEIPGGFSGNNSGNNSPISGTGEDAKEIKAKLKLWAHAVAFASAVAGSGD